MRKPLLLIFRFKKFLQIGEMKKRFMMEMDIQRIKNPKMVLYIEDVISAYRNRIDIIVNTTNEHSHSSNPGFNINYYKII